MAHPGVSVAKHLLAGPAPILELSKGDQHGSGTMSRTIGLFGAIVAAMLVGGAIVGGVDYARNDGTTKTVVTTAADTSSSSKPVTDSSPNSGDSTQIKVGTVVAAIGNPFGLDGTFTTGVISGLDRTLPSGNNGRPIRGLLQTDAAVNPGNSGGALFDVQGDVIGINTAIENPGGDTFAGIAYAVPINTPKRFLTQLTSGTSINHPRLGIAGQTLTPDQTRSLGVSQGVAV